MADVMEPEARSRNMSAIRGADTRPEMIVRRGLHARGFRFRLHVRGLPGRPDLVLRRWRAVVFVHGCFWHRHSGCRFAATPSTRPEFWQEKFAKNVARDARDRAGLEAAGWCVATVWECQLKNRTAAATLEALEAWLRGTQPDFELPGLGQAQGGLK